MEGKRLLLSKGPEGPADKHEIAAQMAELGAVVVG